MDEVALHQTAFVFPSTFHNSCFQGSNENISSWILSVVLAYDLWEEKGTLFLVSQFSVLLALEFFKTSLLFPSSTLTLLYSTPPKKKSSKGKQLLFPFGSLLDLCPLINTQKRGIKSRGDDENGAQLFPAGSVVWQSLPCFLWMSLLKYHSIFFPQEYGTHTHSKNNVFLAPHFMRWLLNSCWFPPSKYSSLPFIMSDSDKGPLTPRHTSSEQVFFLNYFFAQG